ncbi:MAG: hypothetical protein RL242_2922, partial [Pseudomonadota bacterium]
MAASFLIINSFSIFIVNIASTSHLRLLIVLLAFSANCIVEKFVNIPLHLSRLKYVQASMAFFAPTESLCLL